MFFLVIFQDSRHHPRKNLSHSQILCNNLSHCLSIHIQFFSYTSHTYLRSECTKIFTLSFAFLVAHFLGQLAHDVYPLLESLLTHFSANSIPQTCSTSSADVLRYMSLPDSTPLCHTVVISRSQWPSGLGHELFSPASTLRSWVRIPHRHGCLCVFCVRFFCFCILK
jgi:hypothetical protein